MAHHQHHQFVPTGELPQDGPSKLGADINKNTRDVHDLLNEAIMTRIGLGLADMERFREGIVSFYFTFKTMEEEWEAARKSETLDPRIKWVVNHVHHPEMLRTQALLKDLAYYYGISVKEATDRFSQPDTPARIANVEHIRRVLREKPYLILAYGHCMYLALFAGGRVLKGKIINAPAFFQGMGEIPKEERERLAANMFLFEGRNTRTEENEVRMGWKTRMGEAEEQLNHTEWSDVIAEARQIFFQNQMLIAELDSFAPDEKPKPFAEKYRNFFAVFLVAGFVYFGVKLYSSTSSS